jgi:hypothetical protein
MKCNVRLFLYLHMLARYACKVCLQGMLARYACKVCLLLVLH